VLYSSIATYVILKLVDRMVGLRVSAAEEAMGLDLSQHDERAYS
ncbi:MAG: ammonium transporter, partial [Nitrospirae bacterium]